jgi:hypothetical protein
VILFQPEIVLPLQLSVYDWFPLEQVRNHLLQKELLQYEERNTGFVEYAGVVLARPYGFHRIDVQLSEKHKHIGPELSDKQ